MLKILRYLRHGPLKCFDQAWLWLGRMYRLKIDRLPFMRSVSQQVGNYGPFKFNPEFAFSDFKHWGKGHNNGFIACIEACRNKHCVVDVGAHIGLVTMPMSSVVSQRGRVIAFEPATMNLKYLHEHIEQNQLRNVELHDCLLGESMKTDVEFFEQMTATGMNSLVVKKNHSNYSKTYKNQMTLDSIFKANKLVPEVIKIDVEGAEINVLKGGVNTIKKYRPYIFLSVHPAEIELLNQSVSDLRMLIHSLGYRVTNIDGSPVTHFGLKEYILKPKHRIIL